MTPTQSEDYPFVKELVTDESGQVRQVVLQLDDYRHLLQAIEDQGLYQAMQQVKHEKPLSLAEALNALDVDKD
ncbi:hypothetical protein [cf. Phormidesmis sp. LEGE 11477]|uniref:hypothetical protein n=1 Tax=cf. Phormidesmis sp. LEGE 11477 TaxID=1828680 RepID=UPI00187F31DE|nr:hypothetical protein [cf. Phormidesmis sp. LEGE 11477]MBE9063792.1 hypothetical protein [cf. Phormidesmis sp. LEGE 11477]